MDSVGFVDFLVELLVKDDLDSKLRKKKRSPNNRVHKFLLFFDNAEEIITQSSVEFKHFLARLQNDCPLVSILITTKSYFTGFWDGLPNS